MIGDGDWLLCRVGCVRSGSFHDRLASGRLPRLQSSHGGTKRRNAERLVDGGDVGGKGPYSSTPGNVVHKAIVGESPADEGPNHRLVVDYEDAVGHRRTPARGLAESVLCNNCTKFHGEIKESRQYCRNASIIACNMNNLLDTTPVVS